MSQNNTFTNTKFLTRLKITKLQAKPGASPLRGEATPGPPGLHRAERPRSFSPFGGNASPYGGSYPWFPGVALFLQTKPLP